MALIYILLLIFFIDDFHHLPGINCSVEDYSIVNIYKNLLIICEEHRKNRGTNIQEQSEQVKSELCCFALM
jgi:hypothetical protein